MVGKRTAVVPCLAALMAGAVGAAPAGARGSDGGYPGGESRHDPAAVRTAAGGEHHQDGVVRGHGNDGARITVRDLLQQTSGIYDDIDDPEVRDRLLNHFDQNRYDATPPSRLVATAMRHAPLCTPPPHGSPHRWAYSNTNYLPAAMIAEKAGGADWRQLVEHRIIGPHERVTIDGPGGVPEDLTEQSYQHTADSAVVSTPSDLDRFFRALAGGRLLPAEQWALMRRTVPYDDLPIPPAGEQGGYGLGLRVVPLTCGGVYYAHEGDGFGVYGGPAVTVSVTSTTALVDEDRLDRAVQTLTDHVLCAPRS